MKSVITSPQLCNAIPNFQCLAYCSWIQFSRTCNCCIVIPDFLSLDTRCRAFAERVLNERKCLLSCNLCVPYTSFCDTELFLLQSSRFHLHSLLPLFGLCLSQSILCRCTLHLESSSHRAEDHVISYCIQETSENFFLFSSVNGASRASHGSVMRHRSNVWGVLEKPQLQLQYKESWAMDRTTCWGLPGLHCASK